MSKARPDQRPEVLDDGPLHYAPVNELGVVFLFADLARKWRLRVDHIRSGFPDCIAYQKAGGKEKRVRIEFEYKSRNFKTHRHLPTKCDWIVCWEHNWPDAPRRLRIIELRKEFGLGFNAWIQAVAEPYKEKISRIRSGDWSVANSASPGDLVLFYHNSPDKCIKDVFRVAGPVRKYARAAWSQKPDWRAPVRLVCRLRAPVFLEELKRDRILRTASFVRSGMRGRPRATEFWPDLHDLIVRKNPRVRAALKKYAPATL